MLEDSHQRACCSGWPAPPQLCSMPTHVAERRASPYAEWWAWESPLCLLSGPHPHAVVTGYLQKPSDHRPCLLTASDPTGRWGRGWGRSQRRLKGFLMSLVPHTAQDIFEECHAQQESIDEESLQERGPKTKRSQARRTWGQMKELEGWLLWRSLWVLSIQCWGQPWFSTSSSRDSITCLSSLLSLFPLSSLSISLRTQCAVLMGLSSPPNPASTNPQPHTCLKPPSWIQVSVASYHPWCMLAPSCLFLSTELGSLSHSSLVQLSEVFYPPHPRALVTFYFGGSEYSDYIFNLEIRFLDIVHIWHMYICLHMHIYCIHKCTYVCGDT